MLHIGVQISFEWIHCQNEMFTLCPSLYFRPTLSMTRRSDTARDSHSWLLCCCFMWVRTHVLTHARTHTQIHTPTREHTHTTSCCLISQQHTFNTPHCATHSLRARTNTAGPVSIKTYSTLYDFYSATYLNAQVVENSQLVHLKFNYQHTPRCL